MNIKNNTALIILAAILLSGFAGYMLGERAGDTDRMPVGMHQMPDGSKMGTVPSSMHDEMAGMTASLEGKEGDVLDQAFLAEMIVHHEGAVAMAQTVLEKGKHPELKQFAQSIITAQTGEIAQMRAWQTAWYKKIGNHKNSE